MSNPSHTAACRAARWPQSARARVRRSRCGALPLAWLMLAAGSWGLTTVRPLWGQEALPADTAGAQDESVAQRIEPSPEWLRVTKNHEVWINFAAKQVMVGGRICLREGMLEMFACPRGTKEHESIVAVQSPARYVHAALVAIGARPGPPVRFDPIYQPAQGTEIDVEVLWRDHDGTEHRVRAQEWVKQMKTGEALTYPWVFAGSGFSTDPDGKEQYYYGDAGEFICVSNFSTATLDLPVESSAANETLMFGAYTDRIPPRDTPVMLLLTPKLPPPDTEQPAPNAKAPPAAEPPTPPPASEPAAPKVEPAAPPAEPAAPPPAPGKVTGSVTRPGGSV